MRSLLLSLALSLVQSLAVVLAVSLANAVCLVPPHRMVRAFSVAHFAASTDPWA